MTADEFRELALRLPETAESEHMGHPDFRVQGKIFATLSPPEDDWGMVKLTPEQQKSLSRADPGAFEPFPGGWGQRGCTKIHLARAHEVTVLQALLAAWRNHAPKKLLAKYGGSLDETR